MILSHFTALFLFALFVSTVFALITKNEPREQFRYGVFVFLSFIAVAFVVGCIIPQPVGRVESLRYQPKVSPMSPNTCQPSLRPVPPASGEEKKAELVLRQITWMR